MQEEPLNNGAWAYVQPRINTALRESKHHKGKYIYVASRDPTSSVATGSKKQHAKEIAHVRPRHASFPPLCSID